MNHKQVFDQLRAAIAKIPLGARPLVLLAVPAFLLHAMFMRSSSEPLPPLPGQAPTERTEKNADLPDRIQAGRLIQQTEEFQKPKTGTCFRDANIEEQGNYLCRALLESGYLVARASTWQRQDIQLTPEARTELAADLDDGLREITLVVGRRVLVNIEAVTPPPHIIAPPLKYATRVDFTWRWEETNRAAQYLGFFADHPSMHGIAYLLRNANNMWTVADVQFQDETRDYNVRP